MLTRYGFNFVSGITLYTHEYMPPYNISKADKKYPYAGTCVLQSTYWVINNWRFLISQLLVSYLKDHLLKIHISKLAPSIILNQSLKVRSVVFCHCWTWTWVLHKAADPHHVLQIRKHLSLKVQYHSMFAICSKNFIVQVFTIKLIINQSLNQSK